MDKKFLPIGSVVLLDGGEKKLMITGFCTTPDDTPDQVYDYCGCLYPEGVISSEEIYVFNQDQIEEVSFVGYEDEEAKEFQDNLKKVLDENNTEDSETNNTEEETKKEEIERL